MNDRDFLIWIHARLTDVHGENPHVDYMHKLRAVIKATPADQLTPNVATCNNINDLISDLANIASEPTSLRATRSGPWI